MPAYYPVFLDVRNRRCVIIGGGNHGQEKAEKLLEYDARIVVISPEVNPSIEKLAADGKLEWIRRGYQAGDFEGAFIAIVADTSSDEVNRLAYEEAKSRNVPLNVMDVTHLCTFIAPAVVRRGDVIAAVSTGGASPALARKFRELLSGSPIESDHHIMEYAELAKLLGDVRAELRGKGVALYADHWQAVITDNLVDLVLDGKYDEARNILMSDLGKGANCDCENGVCKMWEEKKAMVSPQPVGD